MAAPDQRQIMGESKKLSPKGAAVIPRSISDIRGRAVMRKELSGEGRFNYLQTWAISARGRDGIDRIGAAQAHLSDSTMVFLGCERAAPCPHIVGIFGQSLHQCRSAQQCRPQVHRPWPVLPGVDGVADGAGQSCRPRQCPVASRARVWRACLSPSASCSARSGCSSRSGRGWDAMPVVGKANRVLFAELCAGRTVRFPQPAASRSA